MWIKQVYTTMMVFNEKVGMFSVLILKYITIYVFNIEWNIDYNRWSKRVLQMGPQINKICRFNSAQQFKHLAACLKWDQGWFNKLFCIGRRRFSKGRKPVLWNWPWAYLFLSMNICQVGMFWKERHVIPVYFVDKSICKLSNKRFFFVLEKINGTFWRLRYF